ncbi:MAG: hypothetical protein E4H03_07825 [Myxococcales bacterium]|nr:MAG: hypothetical protein E4H03_07825 [Myxococcales bacterium]
MPRGSRRSVAAALGRLVGLIGTSGTRYIRDVRMSDTVAAAQLVSSGWRSGALGRLGVALVAAGTLLTAWLVSRYAASPRAESLEVGVEALYAGLALFTAGCAFAMAAAARLAPHSYLLVCTYLAWYGMIIGGALAGTPAFAIPTMWMLVVGWSVCARSDGRAQQLWLLLLCLAAGYLTCGAFGMRELMPDAPLLVRSLLLGAAYFALLANPLAVRTALAGRLAVVLTPVRVFGATCSVLGIYLYLAVRADLSAAASATLLAFQGALGVADLVWMWLGAGLFVGALDLGRWLSRESRRVLPSSAGRWLIPATWLGVAAFSWLATYPLPGRLVVFSYQVGLHTWVTTWSQAGYFAVHDQLWASVAVIAAALVLLARGRTSDDALAMLNGLWLAAAIGLLGYHESMNVFVDLKAEAARPLSLWPAFVLVGGLLWSIGIRQASWAAVAEPHLHGLLAFLLMMLAVSVVILAAGSPQLIIEYTLYSFQGVLFLGIPVAAYALVQVHLRYEPVAGINLATLFVAGCASAVALLGWDPDPGRHFAFAPLLWAAVLALAGQRLARLRQPLDGVIGGATLGLGFMTFWMQPGVLPVPWVTWFNEWQMRYSLAPPVRPLFQAGHWWLTVASLGAGALVGYAFASERSALVRLSVTIAVAVVFAVIAPQLPGVR